MSSNTRDYTNRLLSPVTISVSYVEPCGSQNYNVDSKSLEEFKAASSKFIDCGVL